MRRGWTKRAALVAAVIPLAVLAVAAQRIGRDEARAGGLGEHHVRRRLDRRRGLAFGQVIKAFNKQYPDVKVNYKPVGDNLPTVVSTAVAGGNPPDMADIAQPGLVKQFVDKGALKPITYARKVAARELRAVVDRARHVQQEDLRPRLQGEQQVDGLVQRPRVQERRREGRRRRGRSSRRLRTRCKASGVPPYSIGGADGWTLTDLFENIYLRQAGPGEVRAADGAQDQVDRPVGRRPR